MNFYSDSSEWQFLTRNAIDWDSIIPLYYPSFPTQDGFQNKEELIAFFEQLLTTTGKWSGEVIAPRARELDRVGSGTLVDNTVVISDVLNQTYTEAKEMDIHSTTIDPKFGGLGVPLSVGMIAIEQLGRACFSTCTQIGFFASIADMMERFCDEETQKKYIPMIARGEISGSMCMTEPNFGSDVGSIRASAEEQPDGTYLLNGTKCFITNAGGGLAFILARIKGAPAGLDGISMFFAEEWHEGGNGKKIHNYKITKIEEKLGLHGSPTCEVVYENTVARLVGEKNKGFKIMLHLMNEARITVGLQTIGGIEACVGYARDYAETRKQFGKPLMELPLFRRNMLDWETERDAIRALMADTISNFDIFQRLDLKKRHTGELNEHETKLFKRAAHVTRARTPLVKFYGSEAFAMLSQRSIQALGGYGFMKEYDAERFHRDSFGALLYEGTSQIQSLMALKDFVKGMLKDPARFLQSILANHPVGTLVSDGDEFDRSFKNVLYEFRKNVGTLIARTFKSGVSLPEKPVTELSWREALGQVNKIFSRDYWQESERFEPLMVHAETLCQALSYIETLKVLSRHASKHSERGELYHRYLRLVTPRLAAVYADWKIER